MRISTALLTLPLAAVLVIACGKSEVTASPAKAVPAAATTPAGAGTPAVPAAAPAKRNKRGKQYQVVARPVTMKVGGKTVAKLIIEPAKGMKFNKEFPSKFIVTAGSHAACDKKKLSARSGDVKVDGKKGVVSVPLSAKAAGKGDLGIIGHFSICNDEQCFVLRGERLTLNVTVR